MKHTIMTEKFVREGRHVPEEFLPDPLTQIHVSEAAQTKVISLRTHDTLESVRAWLSEGSLQSKHHGYPVLTADGQLKGVVLRSELLDVTHQASQTVETLITREPVTIGPNANLRDALELMAREDVGRLVVKSQGNPYLLGILTHEDIHVSYRRRLPGSEPRERVLRFSEMIRK
jgi:predicted transcriptional regulator